MWDFAIGRTLAIMARTWPFIALRLIVYFGITLAYIVAVGAGAGVGWGAGHIFAEGGPEGLAFYGGIAGFGIASAVVYWIREYILYVVKAGHIAVMVHLIDGRDVPGGQGQFAYARKVVTERFVEANVLFAMDQLVKGAVAAITGLVGGIAAFLPIPGLQGLVAFVNSVIRMSLTYVDEIILGRNIRIDSRNPFETARQGVVLYAQNGLVMIKNAVWLSVIIWVVALGVFVFMLGPAAAVVYYAPGMASGWGFVLAILFAWAVKAALIEPFAICALMQVYFKVIDGQVPNPDWDRRLSEASKPFRELKEKAFAPAAKSPWGAAGTEPGS